MSEAWFWKLLRNSEAQPKFTLSYKKIRVVQVSGIHLFPKYFSFALFPQISTLAVNWKWLFSYPLPTTLILKYIYIPGHTLPDTPMHKAQSMDEWSSKMSCKGVRNKQAIFWIVSLRTILYDSNKDQAVYFESTPFTLFKDFP